MRSSNRKHQRGFTLIEMMITLVIMGIGLTMVVPRINQSIRLARVEETEARLQSDLKLAISTAKATGRSVLLNFDEGGYRVVDSADSNRIYASSKKLSGISITSDGNAQIFPWGLVAGGTVVITCPSGSSELTILPTGKLDEGTGY